MNTFRPIHILIATVAAALVLGGCSGRDSDTGDTATQPPVAASSGATPGNMKTAAPLSVVSIDLGKDIDAENKVTHPASTFAPHDTVYASVNTAGNAAGATLMAHWTYQTGKTVDTTSTAISPTGPASTAFHLADPDGLPGGSYKLEISLDGKPVASKGFSVK